MFSIINRFTITKKQIPSLLKNLEKQGVHSILDYTNENKSNHRKNYLELMNVIESYPNQYFAVKLSSLDVFSQFRVETYLQNIVENAIQHNSKILIDAEQHLLQDKINTITNQFVSHYNKNNVNIYKTYQMYRRDSLPILQQDLCSTERDFALGIKLVRGAYYNEDKVHDILYPTIEETHYNYNTGIRLFTEKNRSNDVLMCATHNENSTFLAKKIVPRHQLQFAHLLGMSNKLSQQLAKENYNVFKYVPYGNFHDTIPYLLRRLYENYPMLMNIIK